VPQLIAVSLCWFVSRILAWLLVARAHSRGLHHWVVCWFVLLFPAPYCAFQSNMAQPSRCARFAPMLRRHNSNFRAQEVGVISPPLTLPSSKVAVMLLIQRLSTSPPRFRVERSPSLLVIEHPAFQRSCRFSSVTSLVLMAPLRLPPRLCWVSLCAATRHGQPTGLRLIQFVVDSQCVLYVSQT